MPQIFDNRFPSLEPRVKFLEIEIGDTFTVSNSLYYIKVGNNCAFDFIRNKLFLFVSEDEVTPVEVKIEICKNT